MDEHLKRSMMIEHYQNPLNKGLTNKSDYIKVNMDSKTCIDNLTFEYKIENDVIKDAHFDGEACAISTSSASILTEMIKGKTLSDALDIINNFKNMIDEKKYNKDILLDANVYDEIYKQPNRKKCALLPYDGLKKIIEEYKDENKKA